MANYMYNKFIHRLYVRIFCFRASKHRNVRSLYHCEDCHCPPPRHLTPPSVRTHHRRTSSRAAIITKEEDDIIPDDDLPSDLINLLENKSSNWDVRKRSLLARH